MQLNESEDVLIQRAVKRDRLAFATLYDKYAERIYRHVYYRVSNQTDAEDITQEIFVIAWKAIDKYKRTGAPFVTWLIAVARNLIVDHYKSKKKLSSLEGVEVPSQTDETNPEALAEANLNRNYVRKVVSKLKGDKQKVIIMRFIDGFSYEDIAGILHKSEGAVRVIQYRALSDLRRMLMRSK